MQIRDADGGRTDWGHVGDYMLTYNSSVTPLTLLTPAASNDFDLWSTEAPAPPASAPAAPLPPSSFAVAANAGQLLSLLQVGTLAVGRVGLRDSMLGGDQGWVQGWGLRGSMLGGVQGWVASIRAGRLRLGAV